MVDFNYLLIESITHHHASCTLSTHWSNWLLRHVHTKHLHLVWLHSWSEHIGLTWHHHLILRRYHSIHVNIIRLSVLKPSHHLVRGCVSVIRINHGIHSSKLIRSCHSGHIHSTLAYLSNEILKYR